MPLRAFLFSLSTDLPACVRRSISVLMPLRAFLFSLLSRRRTAPTAGASCLNALAGVFVFSQIAQDIGLVRFAVKVLMPLRAFLFSLKKHSKALKAPRPSVLMPLRAFLFSLFYAKHARRRRRASSLNALAGVFVFSRKMDRNQALQELESS